MAEDSIADGFGKVVIGAGLGFALYMIATGLGFGFGFRGAGDGAEGRQDPVAPAPPAPTPRAPDLQRLTFVMQEPETAGKAMAFRLADDDPSTKTYTLEEMIARIRAGARSDVALRIRGSVLQGPADRARLGLEHAGISIWSEESVAPAVSGNARGHYGVGVRRRS